MNLIMLNRMSGDPVLINTENVLCFDPIGERGTAITPVSGAMIMVREKMDEIVLAIASAMMRK